MSEISKPKTVVKKPMMVMLDNKMEEVLRRLAFDASSPFVRFTAQDVIRTIISESEQYTSMRKVLSNGNKAVTNT